MRYWIYIQSKTLQDVKLAIFHYCISLGEKLQCYAEDDVWMKNGVQYRVFLKRERTIWSSYSNFLAVRSLSYALEPVCNTTAVPFLYTM